MYSTANAFLTIIYVYKSLSLLEHAFVHTHFSFYVYTTLAKSDSLSESDDTAKLGKTNISTKQIIALYHITVCQLD